jgi:SAM-dependent methyltransferase
MVSTWGASSSRQWHQRCGGGIGLAHAFRVMAVDGAFPHDRLQGRVAAYYRRIAPFYDAELAERGDERFWRGVARERRGGRVLELGCGSGRVTALLAPLAAGVVGVDLSPELLARARVRLAGCSNVRLLRADMRQLVFREPFDLVVAANDPFSHLLADGDRARTLDLVGRHLAPGGRFVLDALWLAPGDESAMAHPDGRVGVHACELDGQTLRIVETWRRMPGSRWYQARYEYHLPNQEPVVAAFEARAWSSAELADGFQASGLTVLERWGDFERSAWDAEASHHLIVVAERA